MLNTEFWQRAALALPPAARRRHGRHLERAERIERVVAAVVDFWRRVERALVQRVHAR
ncbi:MAG: hypothetical protein ABR570_03585 [Burkholderiales bacterium]